MSCCGARQADREERKIDNVLSLIAVIVSSFAAGFSTFGLILAKYLDKEQERIKDDMSVFLYKYLLMESKEERFDEGSKGNNKGSI